MIPMGSGILKEKGGSHKSKPQVYKALGFKI